MVGSGEGVFLIKIYLFPFCFVLLLVFVCLFVFVTKDCQSIKEKLESMKLLLWRFHVNVVG